VDVLFRVRETKRGQPKPSLSRGFVDVGRQASALAFSSRLTLKSRCEAWVQDWRITTVFTRAFESNPTEKIMEKKNLFPKPCAELYTVILHDERKLLQRVVVTKATNEIPSYDSLYRRAWANGPGAQATAGALPSRPCSANEGKCCVIRAIR